MQVVTCLTLPLVRRVWFRSVSLVRFPVPEPAGRFLPRFSSCSQRGFRRLFFIPFKELWASASLRVQVSPSELEATLGQAVHVTVDASPLVGF
jgi:hypothetical protein